MIESGGIVASGLARGGRGRAQTARDFLRRNAFRRREDQGFNDGIEVVHVFAWR
jgi:hypothetical protein